MQIVGADGYEGETNAIDRRVASSAAIRIGSEEYAKWMDRKLLTERAVAFTTIYPDLPPIAYIAMAANPTHDARMWEAIVPILQRQELHRRAEQRKWDNGGGFLGVAGDIWHGVIPSAWDAGYAGFKTASRWTIAAGLFPLQATTNLVGSTMGALDSSGLEVFGHSFDSPGIGGGWRNFAAGTDLGQMAANPTNTGSGFVPGGDAHRRALQAQMEGGTFVDPSGQEHAFSFGRFGAHVLGGGTGGGVFNAFTNLTQFGNPEWAVQSQVGRDTGNLDILGNLARGPSQDDPVGRRMWETARQEAWDTGSGAIDFYVAMKLDPAINLGKTMRSAALGRRTFRAATMTAEEAKNLRGAAGFIEGYRNILHGPTVQKFLDSKAGQELTNILAKTNSPAAIGVLFGGKSDPRIYGELARITDPADMRRALDEYLGVQIAMRPTRRGLYVGQRYEKILSETPGAATANADVGRAEVSLLSDYGLRARIGRVLRPEAIRWKARMGVGSVWADDPRQAWQELTAYMDSAKIPYADREQVYNILANYDNSGDIYNATTLATEVIKKSLFARNAKHMSANRAVDYEDALNSIFTLWNHSIDDAGLYWIDELGKPLSEQAVVINGVADSAFGPIPGPVSSAIGDGPIAASQILASSIVLPDARMLRSQASAMRDFMGRVNLREVYKGGNTFSMADNYWMHWVVRPLDAANRFWKANVLLRIGAMFRNIGEAQASMAANGSVSLITDPAEFMALVIGANKGKLALAAQDVTGRTWNSILSDVTKNHYLKGITPQSARAAAETKGIYLASGFVTADRVSEHYAGAWVDEIVRTHDDDTLRNLAQALTRTEQYKVFATQEEALKAVRDSFWDGDLRDGRHILMMRGRPRNPIPDELIPEMAGGATRTPNVGDLLGERGWSDGYLDQVLLDKWLRTMYAGDDEILNTIATGQFRKFHINRRYKPLKDDTEATLKAQVKAGELTADEARDIARQRKNAMAGEWRPVKPNERGGAYVGRKALQRRLEELKAQEIGPAKVRHKPIVGKANRFSGRVGPIAWAWDMLYSVPSTKLSVHPGWKNEYGKELARLMPYMDDEALTRVHEYLPERILKGVDWKAVWAEQRASGSRLTLKEADQLASMRATDWARETFYDVVNNSKIHGWDVLRFISPFGEAWQDALVRWSKYLGRNPMLARRIPQGIGVGQDIPIDRQGTHHLIDEDPTTGDLVIRVPLSGALLNVAQELWPGAPDNPVSSDITMPVTGLNMVLQSLPGFGPTVTFPLAQFLPDTLGWEEVRKIVFPFGEPQLEGGILEAMAPGWLQKWRTAVGWGTQAQKNAFANDKANALIAIMVENKYDLRVPAQQKKAEREAENAARALYFARGLAQVLAPSAPDTPIYVTAPDAKTTAKYQGEVNILLISNDLRRYQQRYPDDYVDRFLADYGADFYLLLQPKSYTQSYGLNATRAFGEWAKSHQTALDEYPAIAGLFGPGYDDPNNEVDFGEYNRQFDTGERRNILTDAKTGTLDWIALGQNKIGQYKLDKYKIWFDKTYPNATAETRRKYVNQRASELVAEFPGFGNEMILGRLRRVEVPRAINDLQAMSTDIRFASMPGMSSVRFYLQQRATAIEYQRQLGLAAFDGNFASVSDGGPDAVRLELQRIGDQLSLTDPQFRRVWDELLSQEAGIARADEGVTANG